MCPWRLPCQGAWLLPECHDSPTSLVTCQPLPTLASSATASWASIFTSLVNRQVEFNCSEPQVVPCGHRRPHGQAVLLKIGEEMFECFREGDAVAAGEGDVLCCAARNPEAAVGSAKPVAFVVMQCPIDSKAPQ